MWYGIKKIKNPKLLHQTYLLRSRLKLKKVHIYKFHQTFLSRFYKLLWIPTSWNFLFLKNINKIFNQLLYCYNKFYYIKITISYHLFNINILNDSRFIILNSFFPLPSSYFFLKSLQSIFYNFSKIIFIKIKFRGKGYYIYKNKRNTLTPQFGYAHRILMYSYSILVKFLSKTIILLFGLSKIDLIKVSYQIIKPRPINIFTGRGVRFSSQLIYRKIGKVSTYR